MRITICTGPMLPVPAVWGGAVPRLWAGLAREFAREGHDVTVVARACAGQAGSEVVEGVRFVRWGGFRQSRWIARDLALDFAYAVRLLPRLPEADVLVLNDFWLPALAALRPSAGKPVLNVQRLPKGQFRLYRGVSRFAAVSPAVVEAIRREAPALAERVRLFPNAIDLSVFGPPASPRPRREPLVLYAGRVHPEKGLELLLAAFRSLSARRPEARLEVVGPWQEGEGGGGRRFRERLLELGRGLRLALREPVFEPAKLADLYRSADVFCYPSLAEQGESFGVAVLEAMACGVPPVVSDLACFGGLVEPGRTGRVFARSGEGAAERLALELAPLLDGEDERIRLGRAARERASGFGLGALAARYLEDFAALLAPAGPAGLAG